MHAHPRLVATETEIVKLAVHLSARGMIALDTEFVRETTFFPMMALIQVATESESWLVDPLALKPHQLKPLLDVLENPGVLKILHAAQADQECLYVNYGVVATPSLDTACAASLCGYGDSIGLAKLLKEALGVNLRKGHARTDWTIRPIQEQLLLYAHADVQHLIPLAMRLFKELDAKGRRNWALELSARLENKRNYELNPDAIAQKLARGGRLDRRGYAVLRELVAWREKRVREVNVPRRRIADDDVLMDLANVRPRDMNHLSAFRGLNRGELKHSGQAILVAMSCAMAVPEPELAEVPRQETPYGSEARAIELIQCFLKLLAEDLQISARHLISSEGLLCVLRGRFASPSEIVRAGHLGEGAAAMIGEQLLAMVRGGRALAIKNGKASIVDLP